MSEPGRPQMADVFEAQARVSRALALSLDYYDEAINELRQAVLELNAQLPELRASVEACERIARNEGLHRRPQ